MRRLLLAAAALVAAVTPARAAELDPATADRFAKLALACVDREYPNKPEMVLEGADDLRAPKADHPAFYGCYDWHSSVHGHWLLARLLRVSPGMSSAARAREVLDAHLSEASIAAETRYVEKTSSRAFERPYGWAWTLRLAADLQTGDDPQTKAWRERIRPLETAVVARFQEYLPKLTLPVRSGVHPDTAFALAQALDYSRAAGQHDFEKLLLSRASYYYGSDRACPLAYEPSGEDFLSPCLAEADLMRRVMPQKEYVRWLKRFMPQLARGKTFPLTPATVTDPTDPKLVHLDGLNLSRAWMLRGIASALPPSDARRTILLKSAAAQEAAGLARVSAGDYAGEHWLASFAVYLLTEP